MEIVHVVLGKANPLRMNGVNKVVNELAVHQARSGQKVSVWGITYDMTVNYPERPYSTRLFKAYTNRFSLDKALISAVAENKGKAIYHLHGGFIPTFFTLSRIFEQRNIPFVFTPHGSYNTVAMQKSGWRKRIYFSLYERRLLRAARAIHCLGRSEVEGLQRIWRNEKTVLVQYGFELPVMRRVAGKRSDGTFVIGFCGRLDIHTKGLDTLLRAFSIFNRIHPDSALWIVGDSKQRRRVERMLKRLKINHAAVLWGSKYGDEKINILKEMTIFVHPSRNEALPTAVLEAASLGIPCVVTEATNIGDNIRAYDCGEVVPDSDHQKLVNAFSNMYHSIAHNGINEIAERARAMVHEQYNWRTVLKSISRIYKAA